MTIITPTKITGARSMSIEMTEVPPDLTISPTELAALAPGTGLNSEFLSDTLSGFLAHAQCGVHLYRTVAGATVNPTLQAHYQKFLGETENQVVVLARMIAVLGGDPMYVSPTARLVHAMDTSLIQGVVLAAGSADVLPRETSMLEAVLLAETKSQSNWSLLTALSEQVPDGPPSNALGAAVGEVADDVDEHVEWARNALQRMNMMQATNSTMMKIADFAAKAFASVKNAVID